MMVIEREQQRRVAGGGRGVSAAPASSSYSTASTNAAAARSSVSVARERLGLPATAAHSNAAALPAPVPQRAGANVGPMAHRGSRAVRRAKILGWRSPMTLALLGASFGVSLCCLYVSAYARVTQQGNHLAQIQRDLKAAEAEEADLKAQISAKEYVDKGRAKGLGLLPAPSASLNVLDAPATSEAGGR